MHILHTRADRTRNLCAVFHGSELELLFGQFPSVEQEFAEQMAEFYINFISDLNPGCRLLSILIVSGTESLSTLCISPMAPVHAFEQGRTPTHAEQHHRHTRWSVLAGLPSGPHSYVHYRLLSHQANIPGLSPCPQRVPEIRMQCFVDRWRPESFWSDHQIADAYDRVSICTEFLCKGAIQI